MVLVVPAIPDEVTVEDMLRVGVAAVLGDDGCDPRALRCDLTRLDKRDQDRRYRLKNIAP